MSGAPTPWDRVRGKGMYPHQYAGWLVHPLRHLILPPGRLVRRMEVSPTDRVLEIGCGPGWFAPSVARAAFRGRLVLLDAQKEMIDLARARIARSGAPNVTFEVGRAEALPWPDGAFDLVYMVTVLGEVPDPGAAVRAAARVLAPGGRLSITEAAGDPDRLRAPEIDAMADAAGLAVRRVWKGPLVETRTYVRKP